MNYPWSKTVFPIASIFSFRMLGLFMLIPVFSVYATALDGATPALIGIALGAYGLSQGFLQMPFGWLSDKYGRKPVITVGLLLFIIGSYLGAVSDSIYTMIAARILQGMGAIGSVLIALLADLTPDKDRTKAMAVIGITIGTSFSLAMILSPVITEHYGLSGIFYFTMILATTGLLVLHLVIPNPAQEQFHQDSEASASLVLPVLKNLQLQSLNASIFCQHFILTATFFAVPLLLKQHINEGHLSQPWHFYLPLMVSAFIFMVPFIILGEKKNQTRFIFIAAVGITALMQGLLALFSQSWLGLVVLMFCYFVAFNLLEAMLPSMISKKAPAASKGTAMGVYSTCQFLGLFAGGALSGVVYQSFGASGIFLTNGLVGLIWLWVSFLASQK